MPPIKVFGNAGGPDHDVPLPHAALSGRTFEIMGGDGTRYVAPETFDEWLAGLDNRPPGQRPGQWAMNTLTPELWTAVVGTPFDAFHVDARLPDLIRYAGHWWGVMEVSKDGASIPACVFVAVKRGKVPGDIDGCAAGLETEPGVDHLKRGPGSGAALSALCHLTDFDTDGFGSEAQPIEEPTKERP